MIGVCSSKDTTWPSVDFVLYNWQSPLFNMQQNVCFFSGINIDSSIGDFLWSWTKLTLKVSFRALHRYRRVHGLNSCANLNLLSELCLHYCSSNVHYNKDRYLSIRNSYIWYSFLHSRLWIFYHKLLLEAGREKISQRQNYSSSYFPDLPDINKWVQGGIEKNHRSHGHQPYCISGIRSFYKSYSCNVRKWHIKRYH